jgi:hypothetical protein
MNASMRAARRSRIVEVDPMDLHQRQQFDFLLLTAVERFVERIEQRNEGAANALARLRADAQGQGIWLDEFAGAIFQDFLLDNIEGACFVLSALAKRHTPAQPAGRIEATLIAMAKAAFAELLKQKSEERLEQALEVN